MSLERYIKGIDLRGQPIPFTLRPSMDDIATFELTCGDLDEVLLELAGPLPLYETVSQDPARTIW